MGISIWQLAIILGIVVLLFGTKKLRNIGNDLGSAVKGFKTAMKDEEEKKNLEQNQNVGTVIEGEVTSKEKDNSKV